MSRSVRRALQFLGGSVVASVLIAYGRGAPARAGAMPTEGPVLADSVGRDAERPRMLGLGRVEAGRGLLALAAELDGTVAQVPVRLGDTVAAGALLVQLADAVDRRALESARAEVRSAEAALAGARADLLRARAALPPAFRSAERRRALLDAGGTSREAAEAADLAAMQAGLDTTAARARLQQREADLVAARAAVALAAARVGQRQVRAPEAGVVLRLGLLPGEAATAGTTLLELAPLGPRVVRCELDEFIAAGVHPGQQGIVRRVGGADTLARGRVTAIAPGLSPKSLVAGVTAEPEDRRVREVRLELGAADTLPYNARVECELAPAGARAVAAR